MMQSLVGFSGLGYLKAYLPKLGCFGDDIPNALNIHPRSAHVAFMASSPGKCCSLCYWNKSTIFYVFEPLYIRVDATWMHLVL